VFYLCVVPEACPVNDGRAPIGIQQPAPALSRNRLSRLARTACASRLRSGGGAVFVQQPVPTALPWFFFLLGSIGGASSFEELVVVFLLFYFEVLHVSEHRVATPNNKRRLLYSEKEWEEGDEIVRKFCRRVYVAAKCPNSLLLCGKKFCFCR
jgi:hypothetical protein